MKKIPISLSIIVFMIISIVQFSGCGEYNPDYEEVLVSALETADELQTYRIEIENNRIENGEPEGTSGLIEFVAPDRIHTISKLLQVDSGEESIQIGTKLYTRDIDSNDWHFRDWGEDTLAVRNIVAATLQSFTELENIKELEDEEIHEVECYHYIGSMNLKGQQEERIASLDQSDPHYEDMRSMYEAIEYVRDDVEFWIGKDDYLLRKYVTYMDINEIKDQGEDTEEVEYFKSISTSKFYDFNEPIEIESPLTE